MNILLVDDNVQALDASKSMLEFLGHSVVCAGDARNALAIVEEQSVNVVISDIMMPDISGLELLETFMDTRTSLPVILVTAYSEMESAIQALRLGAFDYLTKPVALDGWRACFARLEHYLEMQGALDQKRSENRQLTELIETQRRTDELLKQRNEELELLNRQLKENQKQLIQSEKMASVGQLAAGVAHEINNPVGFVKSNLGTLDEYVATLKTLLGFYRELSEAVDLEHTQKLSKKILEVSEEEDVDYILDDIDVLLQESIDGTGRIQEIVQNLKSFARADDNKAEEADLNEGIEATLNIVWNELKYKCDVHKDLGPLPMIRCYAGQLNQVFLNLLVNASHAIDEHGDITIRTEAHGDEIVVSVSDTGKGIDPEHLGRIFDPFFTTKEIGKGTGLGLAISHGIVESHGGRIEVESELGKGTTFRIVLPTDPPLEMAG